MKSTYAYVIVDVYGSQSELEVEVAYDLDRYGDDLEIDSVKHKGKEIMFLLNESQIDALAEEIWNDHA